MKCQPSYSLMLMAERSEHLEILGGERDHKAIGLFSVMFLGSGDGGRSAVCSPCYMIFVLFFPVSQAGYVQKSCHPQHRPCAHLSVKTRLLGQFVSNCRLLVK